MSSSINQSEGLWLYLKIYTGKRTADHVLFEILFPECQEYVEKGIASEWFFIRYNDPEFHLRFRMKLKQGPALNDVVKHITEMFDPLMKTGLVWKLESDIYVPEYERYGWNSMRQVEQIFYADSNAYIDFLRAEQEMDQGGRWLYALASVNSLLDDFAYEADEKKSLMLGLNRRFGQEYGKDKGLASQLSDRYRTHRLRISEVLNKKNSLVNKILTLRSDEQRSAVFNILLQYQVGKMTIKKNDLLSSLIHMSLNRIFRSNNRLHEMVIYDLLFRAYKELSFRKAV